jgi:hypothetical protein
MLQQQLSYHDAEPTVHYSNKTLWMTVEANGISTVWFLASGARAGARQAREIAAALIACAEEAEATADQLVMADEPATAVF